MKRALPTRLLALAAVMLLLSSATHVAATDPPSGPDQQTLRRLGLRYDGLEVPGPGSQCAGSRYQVSVARGLVACTHGPDPAPDGIDVRVMPSLAELQGRAAAPQFGQRTTSESTPALAAAGSGAVPCVGDGTSGKRLQAIYAYPTGTVSRYDEIAPMIQSWAGDADAVFDSSAAKTGGSRHLRWLHDGDCLPIVTEVELSVQATQDFNATISELFDDGFTRVDRRYVVWVDNSDVYCGIALNFIDDRPGQENKLNGNAAAGLGLIARIDAPCWGVPAPDTQVEAHEIMHTLGAVQPSAPNTSSTNGIFYGHCIDEYDEMCYADSTPLPLVYRCPPAGDRLFDCQDNDYFSTKPPAGSYLATHWNTANSSFLVRVDPTAGFLDVSTSPFKTDIAWLAGSGITTGCTANQEGFCPLSSVTREQMAAFLDRGLHLDPTSTDFFTDDEASIFEASINRMAAANITKGCTPTTFCPSLTITREQMAAFLARALKLPATSTDYFTDDDASPFEKEINRAAAVGVTTGCGGGNFCPTAVVTREQMAAFLHRALKE